MPFVDQSVEELAGHDLPADPDRLLAATADVCCFAGPMGVARMRASRNSSLHRGPGPPLLVTQEVLYRLPQPDVDPVLVLLAVCFRRSNGHGRDVGPVPFVIQ